MSERSYRQRLTQDLAQWQANGWVTSDGVAAIEASLPPLRAEVGLSSIIAVLGGLLFGLGVLSFVAANWELIPRQVRFFVLLIAIALAYGAADTLRRRGLRVFAEAALVVAGLTFGASIALIGQSYHLAGDFSDAILLWALGCLGAALLAQSVAMTALALAVTAYWSGSIMIDTETAHWSGLALLAVGAMSAAVLNSAFARTIAIGFVACWIVVALLACVETNGWSVAGALASGVTIALAFWSFSQALCTATAYPRLAALGRDLQLPSLGGMLVGTVLLQIAPVFDDSGESRSWIILSGAALFLALATAIVLRMRKAFSDMDVLATAILGGSCIAFVASSPEDAFSWRLVGACIVLLASLWSISLGQTGRPAAGKTLGLAVFAVEAIYVYVVTLGTLLDTALALLIGGVMFIALSTALFHLNRRLGNALKGADA